MKAILAARASRDADAFITDLSSVPRRAARTGRYRPAPITFSSSARAAGTDGANPGTIGAYQPGGSARCESW